MVFLFTLLVVLPAHLAQTTTLPQSEHMGSVLGNTVSGGFLYLNGDPEFRNGSKGISRATRRGPASELGWGDCVGILRRGQRHKDTPMPIDFGYNEVKAMSKPKNREDHGESHDDASIYPASLRFQGRPCTVIGAGTIAVRKVESLLAAGAKVRVISPVAHQRLLELAESGAIDYEARPYLPGDAARGFLVVAATNQREVNRQIAAEAERHERFVNVVDDPDDCSLQVPASFTMGHLTVAVSTHGRDPKAAKHLKGILVHDLTKGSSVFPKAVRAWLASSPRVDEEHETICPKGGLGMLSPDGSEQHPAVRAFRDLSCVSLTAHQTLVAACDALAGIGQLPMDTVRAGPEVVGHFALRVPLLEVIAAGATPFLVIHNLGIPRGAYSDAVLNGMHDLADTVGLTNPDSFNGSTEDNVPVGQTGLGVTVIGSTTNPQLQWATSQPGNLLVLAGFPKSAPKVDVRMEDPEIVSVVDVQWLRRQPGIFDIVPVGSRGIRYEGNELAKSARLSVEWFSVPIDLDASGGPSTAVLFAVQSSRLHEIAQTMRAPVTVIGCLRNEPREL